jgi:hypothetical protein
MRQVKNQNNGILEVINSLRKQREKVTTPNIARLMQLSKQWTRQLIKRYSLTEQVDSYNGRNVLDFLFRFNKECPPFLTRKELYVVSHYKGTFEAFKLILWRHKINYRRERTKSVK